MFYPLFSRALLFLLCTCASALMAQHPLQKGYDLMAANKNKEAVDFFNGQLKGPNAAEAYMALSYGNLFINEKKKIGSTFVDAYFADENTTRRNAYLDAMWSPNTQILSEDQIRLVEAMVENPYTRLAGLGNGALGLHYFLTRDTKKAKAARERIGYIDQWQLLGPFENISESGYNKDFGAVDKARPTDKFRNKQGAEIQWFDGLGVKPSGWLYFDDHMPTRDAIQYAQTFADSPVAGERIFRLGTSGSAKVWVNDQLVFAEREERDNNLDTYIFKAPLNAGSNRILLQIGATNRTGSNLLLRLTDENGTPVDDVTFSSEYAAYERAKGAYEQKLVDNPTVAYFKARMDAGEAHYIDHAAYNQYLSSNGFNKEARRGYLRGLEEFPGNAYFMDNLVGILTRLDDQTGASALREKIKEDAPETFQGFVYRMADAEEKEAWPEYEQLLKEYVAIYGEDDISMAADIQLISNRKEAEKLIKLIDRMAKEEPDNADNIIAKATILADYRKKPNDALKLLTSFSRKQFNPQVAEKIIELSLESGDVERIEDMFDQLLENDPYETGYYNRLARLYTISGNKKKAQSMLDKSLAIAPYSSQTYASVATLYADSEEKKSAAEWFRKAIALNPYDYDSRDAISTLEKDGATAFDVFPEVDYDQRFANSKNQEAYPNDHSAVINYDVEQIVYVGGATEWRTSILIKPFTQEGVDAWKEYGITVYDNQSGFVDAAEVLEPGGGKHDASRNGATVVFDGLEPGGAIHLVYRIRDFKYGRMAGKFWFEHPLTLSFPSDESSYSLLTPPGTKFTAEITGEKPASLTSDKSTLDGKDLYVWKATDGKGITPEAGMPNYDDILAHIRVSNIEDWKFVADWYGELTYAKIRPDDIVRGKVDELFAGKTGLTERQEVELIYEYVTNDIRYISVPFLQSNFIPQQASKTILTKQGDCKDVSSLFVAMCDLRGVGANLVLINTRDRSHAGLTLPGTGFNHCIARVGLEGQKYFVELTDENLPLGTGDWSVNNAFAVVIPREGEVFAGQAGPINPPSRGRNAIHRTGKVKIEGDDMVYRLDNKRTNVMASNYRHSYKLESTENQEKSMLEAISDNYPRVELVDLVFDESLNNLSNELTYEYAYRASDVAQTIAGMQIFEVVLSDRIDDANYLTLEERELPIDLWSSFGAEDYTIELTISPPEGKSLVEVPAGTSVENAYVKYDITYEPVTEGLLIKRNFSLKSDRIPVTEYKAFREDMLKVVEGDKVTVAYR